MEEIFHLHGVLSLTEGAGFLVPVFFNARSNYQFVQDVESDGTVERFLILPPECEEPRIRLEEAFQRKVGDEALYAVRLPGVFFGAGDRTDIERRIRAFLDKPSGERSSNAFFRVQAYKFLSDYPRARSAVDAAAKLFTHVSARQLWHRAEFISIGSLERALSTELNAIEWLDANFDDLRWVRIWLKNYLQKDADRFKLERMGIRWLEEKLGGRRYCMSILSTLLNVQRTRDEVVELLLKKFMDSQKDSKVWLPYLVEIPGAAPAEIVEYAYRAIESYVIQHRTATFSSRTAFEAWQLVARSMFTGPNFSDLTWRLLSETAFRPARKIQFWNYLAREPEQRQRLMKYGGEWLPKLQKSNARVFAKVCVDIADFGGSAQVVREAARWLLRPYGTSYWLDVWTRLQPHLGADGPNIAKTRLNALDPKSEKWASSWLKVQSALPDDSELKTMGLRWLKSVAKSQKGRARVLRRLASCGVKVEE